MLYSNLLTLNLLVFNELYFCHVLKNFTVKGRKYHNEDEAIQANKNSLIPFGDYLDNKIDLEGLRVIPKEFEEKAYGLFDEEE